MRAPRSPRLLAIGAITILSLACGSDAVTGAPSVVGTYSLQTVNGAALPATITDSLDGFPATLTFLAPSTIALGSDKSVRIITTVRIVFGSVNEVQTDTATGTYAVSGQQVTFSQPGSIPFTAAWNGSDMLTIAEEGLVFAFKK